MKKIVFLTGTRADFGKIKSLIHAVEQAEGFSPYVFVTGMHLQQEYGYTLVEIQRCGFSSVHTFENHTHEATMDLTLAKTIQGFSAYCQEVKPDLIVVHGDRVETMAGAMVGALNNILVAHIEGGELSGTVDELIRHSVSKLAHLHFVSNEQAQNRLLQMGEVPESVFVIGSPDFDIMVSPNLPSLEEVKSYYDIGFSTYSIAMFHPITTEVNDMARYAESFVAALLQSDRSYVVIYPNNDLGSQYIIDAYRKHLQDHPRFRVFPSLRFEYFLTLLKHAELMVGNSSAGIREAPFYGIPVINIGTRQSNRSQNECIENVDYMAANILAALQQNWSKFPADTAGEFGQGSSDDLFMQALQSPKLWAINHQKQFRDWTI